MVIKRISLTLESEGQLPHAAWAYDLYGALMRKLSPEFAEVLHAEGPKPISQYLRARKGSKTAVWTVALFNERAIEEILPVLLGEKSFFLEDHMSRVNVVDRTDEKPVDEKEFAEKHLQKGDYENRARISLLTPCSFKSGGRYLIMPTAEHVIKSAARKWGAFADEIAVEDDEALSEMVRCTFISSYRLNSTVHDVKKARIPAFEGEFELCMRAPEPMAGLFSMLMHFVEYSGLGMKTALGMGGCVVRGRRDYGKGPVQPDRND